MLLSKSIRILNDPEAFTIIVIELVEPIKNVIKILPQHDKMFFWNHLVIKPLNDISVGLHQE